MAAPSVVFQEVVSFAELKALSRAAGPCITLALLLPNPAETRARLKNAAHTLEKSLTSSERDRAAADLLDPIRDMAAAIEERAVWAKAMLVLRSPGMIQGHWLRGWRKELVEIRNRFDLRPLLAAIAREQRFHLLSLSQGQVRLFQSTMFRAGEEKLPPSTPRNLRAWEKTRQPDHTLDNRATAGPSTGSMKGVMFGTSTDREKHDEYLRHFFKAVDQGVRAVLGDDAAPLVLAGVSHELAIYRKVTTYPRLFERDVVGSPDAIPEHDLLERARDLVVQAPSEPLRKAIADLKRRPLSLDVKEICDIASEGRIASLLISEETENDCLESAARDTICHGGQAFLVRPAELPGTSPAVAVLRH